MISFIIAMFIWAFAAAFVIGVALFLLRIIIGICKFIGYLVILAGCLFGLAGVAIVTPFVGLGLVGVGFRKWHLQRKRDQILTQMVVEGSTLRDGSQELPILDAMEDLVWNHKMFSVDDGETNWNISLSELLEMEEMDEFTKETAVRDFLTRVSNGMPAEQADHIMRIIRQKLKAQYRGRFQLPSPGYLRA